MTQPPTVQSRSLGNDPAYDTPGDLHSILRSAKFIGLSLAAVLAAAAVPLPVPGLWDRLFLLLWVATLAGGLWGGWRAGSAVLLLLVGTLFNLPLILGEGGARYVVWEVGSRVLPAAFSAWMASWLLRRNRRMTRQRPGLARVSLVLFISTLTATGITVWLQRGSHLQLLPVTVLGLAVASVPAALVLRSLGAVGAR